MIPLIEILPYRSVKLNGKPYRKSFITHKNITEGGILSFEMGPNPNKEFARKSEDRPKSIIY